MKPKGSQFQWHRSVQSSAYPTPGDYQRTERWGLYENVGRNAREFQRGEPVPDSPAGPDDLAVSHGSVTVDWYAGGVEKNPWRFYATGEGPTAKGRSVLNRNEPVIASFSKADRAKMNPRLRKSLEGATHDVAYSEQKMFTGGDQAYQPEARVDMAEFTERGSKRFGEFMGMVKNQADAEGAAIVASDNLSHHSGPLVNRLLDAGLVRSDDAVGDTWRWDESESNGITFLNPYETSNVRGPKVPQETVDAGRKTVRGIAKQMNSQRRAARGMKGEQQLPF